jgi:hypothetical protein
LISTGTGGVLVMNVNERSEKDRDHHRDDQAFLILARRLRVERLAELHDVDALRTERGADRRRRRGLAGRESAALLNQLLSLPF